MQKIVEAIDALLPQTQCGLCSYGACSPYAKAIAEHGEKINRCPPGGVKTLRALGALLKQDITPYLADMQTTEKPPQTAYIRADECIGCTKCIQACPVDAIIGSAKQLHTILTSECTGCGLCVAPCPVDCIDIQTLTQPSYEPERARSRYAARIQRLADEKHKKEIKQKNNLQTQELANKKAYIAAALARAQAKRQNNI